MMSTKRETEINYLATFSKKTLQDMLKLAERQKEILENQIKYDRRKGRFIPSGMNERLKEGIDRVSVIKDAIRAPKRKRGDY